MGKYNHPEYREAVFRLICELDIPDRFLMPIRNLIGCSLGRVFWLFWREQDAKDPVWMATPGDHDDPEWHRIDGWPERDGNVAGRKWMRRAEVWMQWHSIDAWHICDWLITAAADGQPWIANVDASGYPKKLMKCGSLERLVLEADQGFATAQYQGHHPRPRRRNVCYRPRRRAYAGPPAVARCTSERGHKDAPLYRARRL